MQKKFGAVVSFNCAGLIVYHSVFIINNVLHHKTTYTHCSYDNNNVACVRVKYLIGIISFLLLQLKSVLVGLMAHQLYPDCMSDTNQCQIVLPLTRKLSWFMSLWFKSKSTTRNFCYKFTSKHFRCGALRNIPAVISQKLCLRRMNIYILSSVCYLR